MHLSRFRPIAAFCLGLPLLSACTSPGIEFLGADRTEIRKDSWTYTTYIRDDRFQVFRTGLVRRSEAAEQRPNMVAAVEEASGCPVDLASLDGDINILTGRLACPG